MTRTTARWTAVALLAAAVGAVDILLAVGSEHTIDRGGFLAAVLGVGWSFAATGVYAATKPETRRIGRLMMFAGFAWLGTGLFSSDVPAVFISGGLLGVLSYGFLAHMLIAFPDGRVHNGLDRGVVLAAYASVTVGQLLPVLFFDTTASADCIGCPPNPLLVQADNGLAETLFAAQAALGSLVIVVLVVALVRRWRATPAGGRVGLAPVLWAGVALLGLQAVLLAASVIGPESPAIATSATQSSSVFFASWVPFAPVTLAFGIGLLRGRVSRGQAVSDLIGRFSEQRGPEAMRVALARALGDPSLALGRWDPVAECFIDTGGEVICLGQDPALQLTEVEHDGHVIGAIVHDAALAGDDELIRSVCSAAALALENERLTSEVRANVAELRASRARIVAAGYEQRKQLERDLHDGAQQRLMAVGMSLQLARMKAGAGSAEVPELIDEAIADLSAATAELRELARGIHPAVLTNLGLGAAVKALVARSPTPVKLGVAGGERLPPAVEAAAYFVIAEALTNVSRYAQAARAEVHVVRSDGHVRIEVIDHGRGGADAARGSGLRGLADRVAALDGELRVTSPVGVGTTVSAWIPCAS